MVIRVFYCLLFAGLVGWFDTREPESAASWMTRDSQPYQAKAKTCASASGYLVPNRSNRASCLA